MKPKITIFILVLIVLLFVGYYFYNKNLFNPPEIKTETSILGSLAMDKAVTNYLLSLPNVSWKTTEGSQNFCVFQNLYPERELFPIYIWIRCGEFIVQNGELKELSGTSLPAKIDYPNELSFYDLKRFIFTAPRDGSLYDRDVKKIFPAEIQDRLHFESGPLNEKIKQEATSILMSK